jgi:hypothetical protein
MKQNRYLLVTGVVTVVCLIAAAVSTAIPDRRSNYGVDVTYNVPEYKTEAVQALEAYQNLMSRYMDLSEKLVLQMDGDCQTIFAKLDSLDSRLADISTRLTRIEKALGIDPNSGIVTKRK